MGTLSVMSQTSAKGARARGAASNERKRSRENRRQPAERHTAEPPPSGRIEDAPSNAPSTPPLARFPNTNRPMKPTNVDEAVKLQAGASVKRAIGKAMITEDGDYTGGRFELAEADDMDAAATAYLDPGTHVTGPQKIGNGGELVIATREAMTSVPGIIDTLRESPDMLNARASRDRLSLTGNAMPMAVDAAQSIRARNSLEKMLAHQLAASHSLAMTFGLRATDLLQRLAFTPSSQSLSVEAARQANAAARMMGAFQDGLVTLERVRRGGKQTVRVVHQTVAVAAGGQAVVAGSMKGGGRKQRGRRAK
jgi:hypothetical protein